MNLEELENLRNLNELDLLYLITKISQDSYDDAESVIRQKRWKVPGVRLRTQMQDIKLIAGIIRDNVQIRKSTNWNSRTHALEKAIEKEKERLQRESESIKKKKKNRLLNNL